MMWTSILVALAIAIVITLVLVGLLGWRRPGAVGTESAVLSGVFFFVLLFLGTWALGVWITPYGPLAFGVPWLGWLAVALLITLLLGVASPGRSARRTRASTPGTATTAGELAASDVAAAGFGILFWALVIALIVGALAGSWRV